MYRLLRPALFRLEAEIAHDLTLSALSWCADHPGALRLMEWSLRRRDPRLRTEAFGLEFANPLGLAAGLDKNARAVPSWAALGFGTAEIGTVTAVQQDGNPQPRMFRLKRDAALINRMGFNNDGATTVAARLALLGAADDRDAARPAGFPVGVNIGKSRIASLDEAAADYRESLALLLPHADYIVLNVSSPNTPGLRQMQERERLRELLAIAREAVATAPKPVLLKIAPDLGDADLSDICALAEEFGIAGIVATNTTISRDGLSADPGEAGGLSGLPLRERSLAVLRFLRRNTRLPLVSVGGVWSPLDVVTRLRAGASLVQIYTSYIYQGPGLVKRMLDGVLRELEREGAASVGDLIGLDAD